MTAPPALEAASEADRRWFESHPGVNRYVRQRVIGEFGPMESEIPTDLFPWTDVVQIGPGVRLRQAFAHLEIVSMS